MLNYQLSIATLISIAVAKFWALVISLGSGTTGVRANDILQLRRWLLEEETGDLRRTTLGRSTPGVE
jgi:hypothetical protein